MMLQAMILILIWQHFIIENDINNISEIHMVVTPGKTKKIH